MLIHQPSTYDFTQVPVSVAAQWVAGVAFWSQCYRDNADSHLRSEWYRTARGLLELAMTRGADTPVPLYMNHTLGCIAEHVARFRGPLPAPTAVVNGGVTPAMTRRLTHTVQAMSTAVDYLRGLLGDLPAAHIPDLEPERIPPPPIAWAVFPTEVVADVPPSPTTDKRRDAVDADEI